MKNYLILFLTLLFFGCKPEKVPISQVISDLTVTPKNVLADGTTIIYISASINNNADADKLSIIFESSAGQFVNTTPNAVDTLITQPAIYQNGLLTANVQLKVPLTAGKIYISARPLATSKAGDFILRDTVNATESVPASLTLTPSASSIKATFGSEIQLTALLKNSYGNNVSTGSKVTFTDYFPGGTPANGVYRALRDTTDATSTAMTYYSVGNAGTSTSLYIKCTYMNSAGTIQVKDSCLINITN